jgi:hypothetical protein
MGSKLEAVSIPAPAADAAALSGHLTGPGGGPLVISEANPRYFTVAARDATDRRAAYLTGSHVNNNFHDGTGPGADCAETQEPNDFRGYLEFLKECSHNFVRLSASTVLRGEWRSDAPFLPDQVTSCSPGPGVVLHRRGLFSAPHSLAERAMGVNERRQGGSARALSRERFLRSETRRAAGSL